MLPVSWPLLCAPRWRLSSTPKGCRSHREGEGGWHLCQEPGALPVRTGGLTSGRMARPQPSPRGPARPQLFNLYPRLGALLQLHRPVLRKIEEVRAILRALLEARRHRTPPRGPQQSYLDALIQQGQVWARPAPAQEAAGGGNLGAPPQGEGLGMEPTDPGPCPSIPWPGPSEPRSPHLRSGAAARPREPAT